MANFRDARLLTAILVAFFILDCFSVISASVPLGHERIHTSWYFGGKSRKLHGIGKPLTYSKGQDPAEASLRAALTPPSPRASQPPPRK
ncbi:hypothetical protein CDL12_27597 [Handroanthus impetiginosus]|uniref:Uncharacterized protein n=1 Tax=Handroanthus impetiginosus TaxID=429701 RepID=A0A2G9G3L2_9LAMI|nr:hypothetical protein CDL12_27597 [Handroanthus impetiginosus]